MRISKTTKIFKRVGGYRLYLSLHGFNSAFPHVPSVGPYRYKVVMKVRQEI